MEDRVLLIALAGLLHDIGKFAHRAGVTPINKSFSTKDYGEHGYHALLSSEFVEQYVPTTYKKSLGSVLFHHRSDLEDFQIRMIRMADQLAAGERRTGSDEISDPQNARLIPILTSVSLAEQNQLANNSTKKRSHFGLYPLASDKEQVLFPTETQDGDYKSLWRGLIDELNQWKTKLGVEWEDQSLYCFYHTLLYLLCKYTWCVPSATPWQKDEPEKQRRAYPDVSLYDHARITSALASCFAYDDKLPDINDRAVLLVRGDLSGIQNFIYRISRPEAETEHVAKRLRGRSFYIQLLTEVAVDWILKEIGLPPSCAVFVGGGRFDLLIPISAKSNLTDLSDHLSQWMLEEFNGEIGIWIATEEATSADLNDLSEISRELDDRLDQIKQTKWKDQIKQEGFFDPIGEHWHVCPVCQLTPMPESGKICALCIQHEQIGKHLPHTRFIAYYYDDKIDWKQDQIVKFKNAPFGVNVVLVRDNDDSNLLEKKQGLKIFSINNTVKFVFPGIASGFRFLATEAPKTMCDIHTTDGLLIEQGDVLPFETIAELSQGAQRLGVLIGDVDRLGLIMSEGLAENPGALHQAQLMRPTLSRIASLSRTMDLFFAGFLNQICRDVFTEWRNINTEKDSVDGLFYIMYSGGDDFFIVGPWDQVLILALRIEEKFRQFAGNNPYLTLSAGYVQIKPRFPVQKFSKLSQEAEARAKSDGRNRVHLFGESLEWKNTDGHLTGVSMQWIHDQSEKWLSAIQSNQINRGLIYDLGRLFRQHRRTDGKLKPLWTPQLFYTLSRRVNKDTLDSLKNDLFKLFESGKTLVAVSITSLKMREGR